MPDEVKETESQKDLLSELESEIDRNEKMIKTYIALEYLIQLIEPKYREEFEKAERVAKTPEELVRLLELAKKHIGQKVAISLLGYE